MSEEWFDRAVAIVVPASSGRPARRGSGYMISPGLVLTALHVVIGDGFVPDPPAPSCQIRVLADITGLREAKLVWPPPETRIEECDVALLQVIGAPTAQERLWTPPPVLETRLAFGAMGCGQPEFVRSIRNVENPANAFKTFYGRVQDRENAYSVEAEFVLDDQRYPDASEWRGASGSVLFDQASNAIFGVLVKADHSGYESLSGDVPRTLLFETLAEYAKRPEFKKIIELSIDSKSGRASSPGLRQETISKTKDLLPQLDRIGQVNRLKLAFTPAPPDLKPVALIGRMREYDRPELFIKTVSKHLAKTYASRRERYLDPTEFSWDKYGTPEDAVAQLKLDIPLQYDVRDDQAFDELLEDGTAPRLFPVRLNAEIQTPTREAFEALLTWWKQRATCQGGPATLLLIVIEAAEKPTDPPCVLAQAIMRAAEPFFGGYFRLPGFDLCSLTHLEDWEIKTLRPGIERRDEADRIASRLRKAANKAGQTVPLKVYADELEKMAFPE
jgi:hypothetical protein